MRNSKYRWWNSKTTGDWGWTRNRRKIDWKFAIRCRTERQNCHTRKNMRRFSVSHCACALLFSIFCCLFCIYMIFFLIQIYVNSWWRLISLHIDFMDGINLLRVESNATETWYSIDFLTKEDDDDMCDLEIDEKNLQTFEKAKDQSHQSKDIGDKFSSE